MVPKLAALLLLVTLASVAAQTFQYSRGWTNGKRAGRGDAPWANSNFNSRHESHGELGWANGKRERSDVTQYAANLEKALSPCQLDRLKVLLGGKALSESFFAPCDYSEDEDVRPKGFKSELRPHSEDGFDTLQ